MLDLDLEKRPSETVYNICEDDGLIYCQTRTHLSTCNCILKTPVSYTPGSVFCCFSLTNSSLTSCWMVPSSNCHSWCTSVHHNQQLNASNSKWNSIKKTQPFINYCWRFGFDCSLRRQPVRPETERRTAIRQTVPTKDPVEAEMSTIINKRLCFLLNFI